MFTIIFKLYTNGVKKIHSPSAWSSDTHWRKKIFLQCWGGRKKERIKQSICLFEEFLFFSVDDLWTDTPKKSSRVCCTVRNDRNKNSMTPRFFYSSRTFFLFLVHKTCWCERVIELDLITAWRAEMAFR